MDWDKAYSNGDAVPNSSTYPSIWQERALAFRAKLPAARISTISYGSVEREQIDFFLPEHTPQGLMVFVHGGYWHKFDRSYWSWLANGALAHGWAAWSFTG